MLRSNMRGKLLARRGLIRIDKSFEVAINKIHRKCADIPHRMYTVQLNASKRIQGEFRTWENRSDK